MYVYTGIFICKYTTAAAAQPVIRSPFSEARRLTNRKYQVIVILVPGQLKNKTSKGSSLIKLIGSTLIAGIYKNTSIVNFSAFSTVGIITTGHYNCERISF